MSETTKSGSDNIASLNTILGALSIDRASSSSEKTGKASRDTGESTPNRVKNPSSQEPSPSNPSVRKVSAFCVIHDPSERFLLMGHRGKRHYELYEGVQRRRKKLSSDKLDFLGGKAKAGELPMETLSREVAEESLGAVEIPPPGEPREDELQTLKLDLGHDLYMTLWCIEKSQMAEIIQSFEKKAREMGDEHGQDNLDKFLEMDQLIIVDLQAFSSTTPASMSNLVSLLLQEAQKQITPCPSVLCSFFKAMNGASEAVTAAAAATAASPG